MQKRGGVWTNFHKNRGFHYNDIEGKKWKKINLTPYYNYARQSRILGAQSGIFWGRGGFLEWEYFDKRFM